MAKNYFTDEQVKQILQKIETKGDNVTIDDYKSLMNLAVETAIKEFNVDDLNERLEKFDKENKPRPINLDIEYNI